MARRFGGSRTKPPAICSRLSSKFRDALRTSDKVIDKRADPMRENDNQDPDEFFVAATRLPRRTLDDHDDPENGARYRERCEQ